MRDLIKVEIAGVVQPPYYRSLSSQDGPGQWLQRLVEDRTPVTCQLLARRVSRYDLGKTSENTYPNDQMAVARLFFRPEGNWFQKDLAESLVKYGRANVSSLMLSTIETYPIVETSSDVKHLEQDSKYMEQLERAEHGAVKESLGMWSDSMVRRVQKDLVEEVEFQTNATMLQQLWRRIRGG